jgi:type I restriction enzyme, R subunit
MSDIGQTERATQNRVITLFRDELGYDYLGNWQDRPNNSNIEDSILTNYLTKQGYNPAQIAKTLYELRSTADNPNRKLYDNNQAVYSLLRYGVQVKTSAGENTETVRVIDWHNPESNHFSIAQEVTIKGQREKRPDIIIYINDRGNALLVAASIYEACKYYEAFQKTTFKGKCAVVTSYNPQSQNITTEDTGANTETDKQFIYNLYTEILKDIAPRPNISKTETYEEEVKKLFKNQPANMKLLIVVDKLLTGFDAPSCTYLYIDKKMQDHGLFQAICRVNRLDGEDKDVGYIVDYKDLFKKVENAIAVYTSELAQDGNDNPQILLQDRLTKGREKLDNALEAIDRLCEPVQPPRAELDYIHYLCGNTEIPADLRAREPQRVTLYKSVARLVRAYANIADELPAAGYSTAEIYRIKYQIDKYINLREIIRKTSGESIDLKAYEADMRHLIDTYIEASEPRKISPFDNIPLLELLGKIGIENAIDTLPEGIKNNREAIAETIENNVRSKIVKASLSDPAYYEKMSALLDEIIADRKEKAIEYEDYLKKVAELSKQVMAGKSIDTPAQLNTPGRLALYNNLLTKSTPTQGMVAEVGNSYGVIAMAIEIDTQIKNVRFSIERLRQRIIGAVIKVRSNKLKPHFMAFLITLMKSNEYSSSFNNSQNIR